MSQCKKKGGIPKTFHTLMKSNWSGRGNYSKWIARQWTDYKRCTSTTRKNKACKFPKMQTYKTPNQSCTNPKTTSNSKISKTRRGKIFPQDYTFQGKNAPSVNWIKSRNGDGSQWRKWLKAHQTPSKEDVKKWMLENGITERNIAGYELWRYKKICTDKTKIPCQDLAKQLPKDDVSNVYPIGTPPLDPELWIYITQADLNSWFYDGSPLVGKGPWYNSFEEIQNSFKRRYPGLNLETTPCEMGDEDTLRDRGEKGYVRTLNGENRWVTTGCAADDLIILNRFKK